MTDHPPSFDEWNEILAPEYEALGASKDEEYRRLKDDLPYIYTKTSNGGVAVDDLDAATHAFYKSLACMTKARRGTEYPSGAVWFNFIRCWKWWCSICGRVGGAINKKRMRRVMSHIVPSKKGVVLRQATFTIPMEYEKQFMSRPKLNSLVRAAQKTVKEYFPGLQSVSALQLFGKRGVFRYRPHVHVLIWDEVGCKLVMPPEKLEAMKKSYRIRLEKLLNVRIPVVDVHLEFVREAARIKHRIRYVTRPMPGPKEFMKMLHDTPLLMFCMLGMKGYVFIRYFNGCKNKGIRDPTTEMDLDGIPETPDTYIRWERTAAWTRTTFNMLYSFGDYTRYGETAYRINPP